VKGDLESKGIDLVIVMRNVWVSDTNLGACGKLCISLKFVAKYASNEHFCITCTKSSYGHLFLQLFTE